MNNFIQIHKKACEEEENYYIDPETNLRVLTSYFLSKRGFCCGAGCKHCPYSVEEQQKAKRPDKPSYPICQNKT